MVIGTLALAAALVVATTKGTPAPHRCGSSRLPGGQSLWVAGVAGLGIALPSVDYLAALAVIAAGSTAASTRLCAPVVFNVVAFALVEIPLLATHLVAPQRTLAAR